MSYFPNFLELQRSNSWMEKNDCQLPRNTMNELVMNYLVTGKKTKKNSSKCQRQKKMSFFFFAFQKDSKKLQKSLKMKQASNVTLN